MKDQASASLRVRVLGPLNVALHGESVSESLWPRKRTKTLLKVLLTDPGQPFSIDQLSEALLPSPTAERATAKNIQARVSELRRLLEPDLERGRDSQYIVNVGNGYAFSQQSSYWLDMEAFSEEIDRAGSAFERGLWIDAAEGFERALGLYRGEFLPEDRYEDWAQATRARLWEQHLQALATLASCYGELGRYRQAISCCQRTLGMEPYREGVIRQLMGYYDAIGQRAKAIDTFHEGARALRERLDVAPSAETRALHEQIQSSSGSEGLDPRRLAVLPFANLNPDPGDEYLADGMTEELIGHLSRIRDLRVIARTSVMQFRDTTQRVPEIARSLGVGSILEGSVRKVRDQLRVSVQLIDAQTEEHLWSEEYDGTVSEVLATEQSTAMKVAKSLEIALFRDEARPIRRETSMRSEAHSLYLRGKAFGQQSSLEALRKALRCVEEAVALDPDFADAHVSIALCHYQLAGMIDAAGREIPRSEGYCKTRLALTRALEINPSLSGAHALLGLVQATSEQRFADAEATYKRAIHLNPSDSQAHTWYSYLLLCMNRIDEALAEAQCVMDLDPLSPVSSIVLAHALAVARRLHNAQDVLAQAIDLHPYAPNLYGRQSWVHWLSWSWDEGLRAALKHVEMAPIPGNEPWYRGHYALYLGRPSESLAAFSAIERSPVGDMRARLAHGVALYHARAYGQAIDLMDRLLKTDSFGIFYGGKSWLHLLRGLALERQGRDREALLALERARDGLPEWVHDTYSRGPILADVARALIQIRRGHQEQALQVIQQLSPRSSENEVGSALAVLNFHLGRIDKGFDWLEAALDHHDEFILTIKTHPWLDPVRDDPRFGDALERMGLAN